MAPCRETARPAARINDETPVQVVRARPGRGGPDRSGGSMVNRSSTVLALAALLALPAAAQQTAYQGHGADSVPPEVIAKFVAPPLPSELSRKIQNLMDVRAPGGGQLSPDGKRLYFGWAVTGTAQVWRLDGPNTFPDPDDRRRGPHLARRHHPRRQDARPLPRPQGRGEPRPLPDAGRRRPDEGRSSTSRRSRPPSQFVSEDGKWLYFRANDVKPNSYADLPLRAGDREEGDRLRRAGPLVRRRPPARRPPPPREGDRLADDRVLGVGPGEEDEDRRSSATDKPDGVPRPVRRRRTGSSSS